MKPTLIATIILAALVGVPTAAAAQNPVPDQRTQTTAHNEKAQNKQSNTPKPSSPATESDSASRQCPAAEGRNKTVYENKTETDWWTRISSIITAICTFALAIIGGIAACIAIKTLRYIGVQTRHAGIAAESSKVSADAASNSIQLLIATERAIIEIDLVSPTTYIDEETGEEWLGTRPKDYARYGISVKNYGKTVARITHCRISSDCAKHEEVSLNRFKMRFESTNQQLLGSGVNVVLENFFFPSYFTDAEWNKARSETERAMIQINIVYQDILKNGLEGRHETSAVFTWDTRKEEPSRLFKYNVYT
jgi:hypothetical protein